jgi:hypothetical protein
MTYQSPRSPQYDPYRGGTAGSDTGMSSAIGRNVRRAVLLVVLAWAYIYPATVANLFGIDPPGEAANALVRNVVLAVGGFVILLMVIGTVVRTRRARQEGIPRR